VERACEGHVAIVTGASRGLGAAIAARLAEEGARVAVSARTLEPDGVRPGSLRETAAAIAAAGAGAVLPLRADISRQEDRERLVAETVAQLGPVDILVNNAAVTWRIPCAEFPEKRFRIMFEVQVRAAFELAQLVLPGMRARRRGWILNLTSRAATHPPGPPFETRLAGFTVYGMCKAALERFTTGLAAEVYVDRVAVNALAPWDVVPTPGAGAHDLVAEYANEGPEWVAEAALALCSGDPARLTGRIAYSQPLLAELGRRPRLPPSLRQLDAETPVGA
jgi:NAD(P)-dependent dehydrogenase (short-subunit alcohol dehydrogenase family)